MRDPTHALIDEKTRARLASAAGHYERLALGEDESPATPEQRAAADEARAVLWAGLCAAQDCPAVGPAQTDALAAGFAAVAGRALAPSTVECALAELAAAADARGFAAAFATAARALAGHPALGGAALAIAACVADREPRGRAFAGAELDALGRRLGVPDAVRARVLIAARRESDARRAARETDADAGARDGWFDALFAGTDAWTAARVGAAELFTGARLGTAPARAEFEALVHAGLTVVAHDAAPTDSGLEFAVDTLRELSGRAMDRDAVRVWCTAVRAVSTAQPALARARLAEQLALLRRGALARAAYAFAFGVAASGPAALIQFDPVAALARELELAPSDARALGVQLTVFPTQADELPTSRGADVQLEGPARAVLDLGAAALFNELAPRRAATPAEDAAARVVGSVVHAGVLAAPPDARLDPSARDFLEELVGRLTAGLLGGAHVAMLARRFARERALDPALRNGGADAVAAAIDPAAALRPLAYAAAAGVAAACGTDRARLGPVAAALGLTAADQRDAVERYALPACAERAYARASVAHLWERLRRPPLG